MINNIYSNYILVHTIQYLSFQALEHFNETNSTKLNNRLRNALISIFSHSNKSLGYSLF